MVKAKAVSTRHSMNLSKLAPCCLWFKWACYVAPTNVIANPLQDALIAS